MKKGLLIIIVASIALIGASCQKTEQQIVQQYKWVNLYTATGYLNFQVPSEWNAYRRDEAQYQEGNWTQEEITGSVSVSDQPVSFNFFNWEQVDFIYSDQDLLTDNFIDSVRNSKTWEWESFEKISLNNFAGFVGTEKVEENGEASKGYPGGQTYYLNHNGDDQGTVLIHKSSRGNEIFNEGFDKILESIDISDDPI